MNNDKKVISIAKDPIEVRVREIMQKCFLAGGNPEDELEGFIHFLDNSPVGGAKQIAEAIKAQAEKGNDLEECLAEFEKGILIGLSKNTNNSQDEQ